MCWNDEEMNDDYDYDYDYDVVRKFYEYVYGSVYVFGRVW